MPVKQVVLYSSEDPPRCTIVAMSYDSWNPGTSQEQEPVLGTSHPSPCVGTSSEIYHCPLH